MPKPAKTPTEAMVGYGTTVEFLTFGFIGRATNFRGSRAAVETAEVTNFDSPQPDGDRQWGGTEHVPTFATAGTISMSVVWTADYKLPPEGHEDTVRVTFPLKKGYKLPEIWSGGGILLSVDVSAETRTAFTAEIAIQRTGVWSSTSAVRKD